MLSKSKRKLVPQKTSNDCLLSKLRLTFFDWANVWQFAGCKISVCWTIQTGVVVDFCLVHENRARCTCTLYSVNKIAMTIIMYIVKQNTKIQTAHTHRENGNYNIAEHRVYSCSHGVETNRRKHHFVADKRLSEKALKNCRLAVNMKSFIGKVCFSSASLFFIVLIRDAHGLRMTSSFPVPWCIVMCKQPGNV